MARNLLTVAEIKAAAKPKLRDGDGLWLHTSKSGNRNWVFIFVRHGRRREMGLGPFGSGTGQVSLAAARQKAEEIRTILGRGGDPFAEMEERQRKVKPVLFGELADEYIRTMSPKWRGRQTLPAWERFAATYAKGLRKIPVTDVDTDAVVRVLTPLWSSKPVTAAKTRERIKLVLDHAKARGLRSGDNPAAWAGHLDQILPPPKKLVRGHHAAMPYSELPAFMKRLRALPGVAARALEFTILTGARSGETRGAPITEFDLAKRVWTVPKERMKEPREHRVPLGDRAIEIVKKMRDEAVNDLVFPGKKLKRPLSDAALANVLDDLGASKWTVHGFRSCLSTWAAEETMHQREVVEAALAHAVGDAVERAYRRGDALAKRRKLMDDWAAFCASAS
ncbi:site-specific integrase [Shinella sp. WSJ-2]|uniref:tyrosine-type recombinase/integrase n=1 Tax=Shinella sp. WSJ-2 TaxID=2303749 RepID=UPI000E3E1C3A|nr:site-specific integrase [Shinella sp. WSJ-2]RFZ81994.1 site-specific integrase [Shinella sp. WSJ-2]